MSNEEDVIWSHLIKLFQDYYYDLLTEQEVLDELNKYEITKREQPIEELKNKNSDI